ncbi:hypothetical protein GGI12_000213 [Dipsacomyces acuminosporus]|nr:hypothetical protein GGI12_000213 [Dipsacomyces acuminosporus]
MSTAAVPDYIFNSGLRAQQLRSSRPLSRPASIESIKSEQITVQDSSSSTGEDADEDLEIKMVIGHVSSAQRAWPEQLQFDVPRLIRL